MKNRFLSTVWALIFALPLLAQSSGFSVSIEEENFPGFPALQSFVSGQVQEKWIFIGGRTDGLHRRQPFAAFDPDYNNTKIYLVDLSSKSVLSRTLEGLPATLKEQLQSSNMEFSQQGNTLFIIGGYGYSESLDEWITYPVLTAVDLPVLTQAIVNNEDIAPAFRFVIDESVRVTGGYLGSLAGTYYLAGGQIFEGRYNPHGPTMGPGFFQQYTNAIKTFQIEDDGTTLQITHYEEMTDSANLHRRDYNLLPQIFPDGTHGFTMFSGVFQYDQDLPWLNTVDIIPGSYTVNNDFNQFLNQYHTAHATLYSESDNQMHSLFFGGISRYFLDANGTLVDDPEVPFVKTISLVSRFADGSMKEFHLGDMPGLLGSSAEFMPATGVPLLNNSIIDLDQLSNGQLIGYIVGGIESTLPNVLFLNGDDLSFASGKIFKVTLSKQTTPTTEISGKQYFGLSLYPNPATGRITVNFSVPVNDTVTLTFRDPQGKILKQDTRPVETGEYEFYFDVSDWPSGRYQLELRNDRYTIQEPFLKN